MAPTERARRVLFDGEAFLRHRRSGISRYFSELVGQYRIDPSLGVDALTPYRYVANAHLKERLPDHFRAIPLPRRLRDPLLTRLNAPRARRSVRADVVHHSLHEPEALNRWTAPRRVCTIYDFTPELHPELFERTTRDVETKNLFINRCDVLACISQTTYDDLRRLHPGVDKPVVITPLAAGREFFRPRRVELRGVPDRYVLYVGNRHPHKNADVLFRAFAQVALGDSTLRLVLCGNHPPDEPDRLHELGIAERTITIRPKDAAMPWLYHRAAAFVLPSRYEGFGLPVVEAMAAGAPTIIADTPALLEVADGAALVFESTDMSALVDALARVTTDETCADDLRQRGFRRASAFSWRRTAELTAHAYEVAAQL